MHHIYKHVLDHPKSINYIILQNKAPYAIDLPRQTPLATHHSMAYRREPWGGYRHLSPAVFSDTPHCSFSRYGPASNQAANSYRTKTKHNTRNV